MKRLAAIIVMAVSLTSCHSNPFLKQWNTPYGIPPFDEIRTSDYIPAVKEGIKQQNAEIDAIVGDTRTPSFENTIAALELSGSILSKVEGVLFNVAETDRTEELDAVVEEAIGLLSAHSTDINFNKALYARVKAVYEADQSALTREQQMVLKCWYEGFEREGIGLNAEQQDELREINARVAALNQKIGNNILAESNAFQQKFGFSVSSYPAMMTTTADRELRRQYNEAYRSRGHNGNEYDNRALILELVALRTRKANILGYESSAAFTLSDKMASNPQTVDEFLKGIMDAANVRAKQELKEMQLFMDADVKAGLLPKGSKIEQWDWWYYAEKVRRAKYDLDEDAVSKYFKAENVLNGVFTAAKTLYGVNAEKIEGVPSYNPDCVTTWKLTYDDGSLIGILTTDLFPRSSKRGGAWMNNVRNQYYDAAGNDVRPIIVNVGNLSEYMSIDDVQTTFHEFGHALHGLLSKCHYPSVSGTSVKRDFVEMFSQFNENWAFQPELLALYAKNDAGEVIPQELVEKINAASKFNQGFMTAELAAASILDMRWHELTSVEGIDVDKFEAQVAKEIGLIPQITYRYQSTYFNHIFGGSGYDSGYYGYLWSEVLDKDAFSIFQSSPNGVWDKDLALKFKRTFLERGGSEEPMVLYHEFAGRDPQSDAMLKARGLK